MMKNFQILGQSNPALSIILDTLFCLHGKDVSVEIVSNIPKEENAYLDIPYRIEGVQVSEVFHTDWIRKPESPCLIGSIGRAKREIFEFFRTQYGVEVQDYANLIHPVTVLPHNVKIGTGVNIGPSVTLAPFTEVGDMVSVNRNVSVGHHTVLAEFVNINPGCTISGLNRIGRGVILGSGTTTVDSIEIGENSVVGAASLVTKSIPPNVVAYGVPAKVVRARDPL